MFAGTSLYTLDKLLYLLDQHAMQADVFQLLHGYEDILDMAGRESIFQTIMLLSVLSVVSWWAFLLYLYVHRAYFEAPSSKEDPKTSSHDSVTLPSEHAAGQGDY